MPDPNTTAPKAQTEQSETPEDVAILYSWANLHGAKYRDFSASRAQAREQARLRAEAAAAAERQRQEEEAERIRQEEAQLAARLAAEAAEAARQAEADRLAEIARQAEVERQAVLAAQEAQRQAVQQRGWQSLKPVAYDSVAAPAPSSAEYGARDGASAGYQHVDYEQGEFGQTAFGARPGEFADLADAFSGETVDRYSANPGLYGGPEMDSAVPLAPSRFTPSPRQPVEPAQPGPVQLRQYTPPNPGGQGSAMQPWQVAPQAVPKQPAPGFPNPAPPAEEYAPGSPAMQSQYYPPLAVSEGESDPFPNPFPSPDPNPVFDTPSSAAPQPYASSYTRDSYQPSPWQPLAPIEGRDAMREERENRELRDQSSRPAWLLHAPSPPAHLTSGASAAPPDFSSQGPAYTATPQAPSSSPAPAAPAQNRVPMYAQSYAQSLGQASGQPAGPAPTVWTGPGTGPGSESRPQTRSQTQSQNPNPSQPDASGAPATASQVPNPVDDTLAGSRDRLTNRWYALKSVFDPQAAPVEQAPMLPPARVPVLAIFSLAGGVGKTSLVASLGRALSSRGERVLLVDTAAYGLLPFFFGARDQRPGQLRTFNPPGASLEAPVQLVTLDPESQLADPRNPEPHPRLALDRSQDRTRDGGQDWLAQEVARLSRGVNRILVDLPTASGATTRRVLKLSPDILVPIVPDMSSVVSVGAIEAFFRHSGQVNGKQILPYYVLNQFDYSLPLHLDVREVLREQIGDRLLPFALRRSPAISEALAEGMTVIDYAPSAVVAEDYASLAGWVRSLCAPATQSYRGVRWSER